MSLHSVSLDFLPPGICIGGFLDGSVVKNLPANAGDIKDTGSIPGLGRSPGGENCYPLQYSCLENPMDRGVWQATVHGAAKSWIKCIHIYLFVCLSIN